MSVQEWSRTPHSTAAATAAPPCRAVPCRGVFGWVWFRGATPGALPWEIRILEELGMINPQPAPNQREVRRFYQADHTYPIRAVIDATITACTQIVESST